VDDRDENFPVLSAILTKSLVCNFDVLDVYVEPSIQKKTAAVGVALNVELVHEDNDEETLPGELLHELQSRINEKFADFGAGEIKNVVFFEKCLTLNEVVVESTRAYEKKEKFYKTAHRGGWFHEDQPELVSTVVVDDAQFDEKVSTCGAEPITFGGDEVAELGLFDIVFERLSFFGVTSENDEKGEPFALKKEEK